jgi:hypothetical protein
MKNQIALAISASVLLLTPPISHAADFGVCNYGQETLSSVTCFGPATLNGTTVTGNVFVAGPLTATHAKLGSLHVAGIATLQNSHVKGTTEVEGPLTSTQSQFDDTLFVASNKMVLTASKINGAVTMKSTSETANLYLTCETVINNSVTFEGMPGIIKAQSGSRVTGDIVNGQLDDSQNKTKCNTGDHS